MPSLVRLLTFVCSAILFGSAVAKPSRPIPVCARSDTKDLTKLEQCLRTTVFAVQAVENADSNFTEACDQINYTQASEQNLDVYFLRYLICGQFGGQGVFYTSSDEVIADLYYARVALRIAEDSTSDPVLRLICPNINLQTLYNFGLPVDLIYDAACGDVYISSPPEYTSRSASSSSASSTSSSSSPSSYPGLSQYPPPSYTDPSTSSSSWTYSTSPLIPSSYTDPLTSSDPLTPPNYASITAPPSPYTDPAESSSSSSTTCTTTSSAVPMYKRQDSLNETYDEWIGLLNSAIIATTFMPTNADNAICDNGDFWIDTFDRLGYDGEYVHLLL